MEKADTSIFRWKSRHVDFLLEKLTRRFFVWKSRHVRFSLEKPTRRFLLQKADTLIFRWKSGHVGPELFSLLKKINLINVLLKKRYQKIHINKVQNEPNDYPVSVDLNSNNSNLNLGSNYALFQLKSTCPLFQRKIDVSAFSDSRRPRSGTRRKKTLPFLFTINLVQILW